MTTSTSRPGTVTAGTPDTTDTTARIFSRDFIFMWAASFSGFFSFYVIQQPTLPLYVESLGGSAAEIGWVAGVFSVASLLCQPLVGRAVDTLGPRTVILTGSLLFLLCAPIYAVASALPLLIALRMVHGAGMAMFTTSGTTYATDLAPAKRRAQTISYFGIGGNLALGLGPLAASLLLAAHVSYEKIFLVATAIALASVLLIVPAGESRQRRGRQHDWSLRTFFDSRAVTPALLLLTASFTYGTLGTFLPVWIPRAGLETSTVAWFWLVYAAALVFTRLFSGRLADRFGRPAAIIPGLILVSSAMFLLSFLNSVSLLVLSAALYAAGFAFVCPTLFALAADRVAASKRGIAFATLEAFFGAGIGISAMMNGVLANALGYPVVFILSGAVPLIGLAGSLVILYHRNSASGGDPS
ncbi:MAG: MFS transporter [Actinobacteria bacterium]|nr:MFS transporter [Actinomycetota bacterium]